MRTVTYRLGDLQSAVVRIGFVGENEHTRVIFDCKKVFDEYPSALAALTVQPPEGAAYPAVVVRDGDLVYWDIYDSDLVYDGRGEGQLAFSENGKAVRSFVFRTAIDRSIVPTGEVPEPLDDFLTRAGEALTAIPQTIQNTFGEISAEAETLPAGSSATAEFDSENMKLSFGIPAGEKGDPGDPGDDGFSPIASVSKSGDTATISITDKNGTTTAEITDGQDGQPGADGYSPTAIVTKTGSVATITLIDKNGTTSAQISDGTPGDPTQLIDDEAGEGDTDKVWSADKSADEVSTLNGAIDAKPDTKQTDKSGIDLDVTDTSGNVLVRFKDGHIQTKNFDSNELNKVVDTTTGSDLDLCDPDGNVIMRLQDGNVQTKNFDSKQLGQGIILRNQDVIDGVYAACRWHQPNASAKQFCILMGADFHGDAVRMNNMVEFLNAVDAFDAGIVLGDIGAWESDATWYTNAISKTNKPFLTVVGNHDAAGNMSQDSTSYQYVHDFYAKFIEPNIQYADLAEGEHEDDNVYYFKDFESQKIRIICINQYDYPPDKVGDTYVYHRGDNCYGQDQITWFCETLANTPSDYGVIIALHSFPESMSTDMSNLWVSSTWFGSSGSPTDIMDHANDGYIIPQIVDAWMNGTSLQKTFHYQPSGTWTECVVDVDFSSRGTGEFITYIGGHWHMSVLGKCYHYHDQKNYSVDCSGFNAATQGDTPRRQGARSEDALCVLAVDRTAKTVKLLRIGAHFTKDGKDRLYGQYSYDNE